MINVLSQQTLFTGQEGFEKAQEAFEELNKGKRGFYHKDYTKPKHTDNPWEEIKQIYANIANYLDVPRFQLKEDEVLLFAEGRIRAWCFHYTDDAYTYEGNIYTGEEFNIIEAEIVGTEKYDLQTRLKLHKEFLNLLEDGNTLEQSISSIQGKLKELEEKNKMGDFALWLKKHRN